MDKTDLSQIKAITKKIVDKSIKDNNGVLKGEIKQAITENNNKLFQGLVTKDELRENYVSKDEFHDAIHQLQITLDKIYGIVQKTDQELTVISHRVNNHETRITTLESALV